MNQDDFREKVFSAIANGIFNAKHRDATDVYRDIAEAVTKLAVEHFSANAEGWRRLAFSSRVIALHEAAAIVQRELDHAGTNELRLAPVFGQQSGEPAVRASHIEAALAAILGLAKDEPTT